jgi:hypothetical protein
MKVYVRKNKFGFQYQKEGDTSWTYFPDNIEKTAGSMKEYFQRNTRDPREIVFCNPEGKPAKLYTIKTSEKFGGHKFATVDFEKKFIFEADLFVPDAEKLEFLQDHSSMNQDQEASKLENTQDKIKFYLNNVNEETKVLYKNFLNEKMTPDVLREICTNNAKTYSLPAEVEIISE